MAITTPVPIPSAPPAPSRNDPATFEERNDAAVEYQFNTLPGAINQQAEATYQNALEGAQSAVDAANSANNAAGTVTTVAGLANAAAGSASAAAADAIKTAADRAAVEQALIDGPVISVNGQMGIVDIEADVWAATLAIN